MSTTLPTDVEDSVPLHRLVAVEMRKMVDTRSGFWLLAIIVVLTAAATVLTAIYGPDDGTPMEYLLVAASTPQGILLPVLGVLLVTGEWGQRAAMTTFVLVPRRERVVLAKVVAAVVVALGAIALTFAIAAAAAALSGASVGDADSAMLGRFTVLQLLGILQGVAFGLLFLNSAAAIVIYFLLPVVSSLLFQLVAPLRDLMEWVDLSSAQTPLSQPDPMTSGEWANVASVAMVWVVVPLALGAWRVVRAEVQ